MPIEAPVAGSRGGRHAGGAHARRGRDAEDIKLLRQWLTASMRQFAWMSVPCSGEGGGESTLFFQVLELERKTTRIRSFVAEGEAGDDDALFRISIQPAERWGLPTDAPPGDCANIFIYTDPCHVDILSVFQGGSDRRNDWLVWAPEESDVEGCLCLRHPRALAPGMALGNAGVPVLALLDALASRGFAPHIGRTEHGRDSPKLYDARGLSSARAYLQCIVALPLLVDAGAEFPSGKSEAFYRLMLRKRGPVDVNMSAAKCKEQLARLDDDALALALLEVPSEVPRAQHGVKRPVPPASGQEVDDEVAGDSDSMSAGEVADQTPADDGESVAGDGVAGGQAAASSLDAAVYPGHIAGQVVTRVRGRSDNKWKYSDRLSIKCSNAAHGRCTKSRSCELDFSEFGANGVVGFLGAWLAKSHLPARAHRAYTPSRDEIREYLATT